VPNTYSEFLKSCIRRDFKAQVESNQRNICPFCKLSGREKGLICLDSLLPVTSQGEDCPYFSPRLEERNG